MLWGTIVVAQVAGKHESGMHSSDAHRSDSGIWQLQLPMMLGDYELLEELGHGGMGIVYRARHSTLNREVAIKMILRDRLASSADRRRFLVEAEATAKLSHPNIVPLYEVGELEGRPYFSMELVRGENVSSEDY